jgi:ABC-2 type transport system ATP-binding protein
MNGTAAIATFGLTRDFPGVRAVDRLSLEVPGHSIFGFLGPNGSGKTTTIRLLLGLLAPTSGDATVLGCDVRRQPDAVRSRSRCSSPGWPPAWACWSPCGPRAHGTRSRR